MDETHDVNGLLAEVNRRLPFEQQINKDDPLYTGIVLNKVALGTYVHLIQRSLDNALRQLNTLSEQQLERAEAVAERVISKAANNGANNVEKQLDAAAQRWEERLRKAGTKSEASMRRASRLAWTGAVLIGISASVLCGSFVGNFVFGLAHHGGDSSALMQIRHRTSPLAGRK